MKNKHLNLIRPICFFDLETTGLDIANDRIVEIAILKLFPDGSEQMKVHLVNPEMPIPQVVVDIHGIDNEKVKNEPTFKELAPNLAIFMGDSDLAGFNSNHFDIPLLVEEFLRAGVNMDLSDKNLIDVQKIFHKKEPRNLAAALEFYCGKKLENAHSAEADIRATYEVLMGQLEKYPDLRKDSEYLHNFTQNASKRIDYAGRFVYNQDKQACFNFGKHKGKTVADVLEKEPGYYSWIMNADFSLNTKQVLKKLKAELA